MEAVKLLALFIAIVVALRLRVSVGVTLFGAGLTTALLYQIPIARLLEIYRELVVSERFLTLTGIIILITIMGALLKELGYLERLTHISTQLIGGKRTAAVSLPVLVGLMPMPGGSLLSAPLVDNVLSDKKYLPHFKCVVNYWSRHTVEHFMPIYPGIIVASGMTGLPLGTLGVLQMPLAIVMMGLGLIFFARHIEPGERGSGGVGKTLLEILATIWPIILTIAVYAIFDLNIALSAMIALIALIIVTRPTASRLVRSLKEGLTYKLVFLVFGILSFQSILDQSGAVGGLQRLATEHHFPVEAIIFVVAFTSGVLTGMLAALVALSYSLLAGFLYQPEIIPANLVWAFISGYAGMMVSPTHLCLTLTNQYFKSDLLRVIRTMVIPLVILLLFGLLLSWSGWPDLVIHRWAGIG